METAEAFRNNACRAKLNFHPPNASPHDNTTAQLYWKNTLQDMIHPSFFFFHLLSLPGHGCRPGPACETIPGQKGFWASHFCPLTVKPNKSAYGKGKPSLACLTKGTEYCAPRAMSCFWGHAARLFPCVRGTRFPPGSSLWYSGTGCKGVRRTNKAQGMSVNRQDSKASSLQVLCTSGPFTFRSRRC